MKFPRYFLSLCVIAFFFVVVSANVDVEEPELDEGEAYNIFEKILALIVAIIRKVIKGTEKFCAVEAARHCKEHWNNPKALIQCAKAYLKANKERCIIG